jgi:hypothetical protein
MITEQIQHFLPSVQEKINTFLKRYNQVTIETDLSEINDNDVFDVIIEDCKNFLYKEEKYYFHELNWTEFNGSIVLCVFDENGECKKFLSFDDVIYYIDFIQRPKLQMETITTASLVHLDTHKKYIANFAHYETAKIWLKQNTDIMLKEGVYTCKDVSDTEKHFYKDNVLCKILSIEVNSIL